MRHLSRDPFARVTYVREPSPKRDLGCDWCGMRRRSAVDDEAGVRTLYRYGVQDDRRSGTSWALRTGSGGTPAAFCSISCARSYGAIPEAAQ